MTKFIENIRLALLSMWTKKIRSLLTMLGIVIGIFSILMLFGIGQGVKHEVVKQIEGLGSNLLFVIPGKLGAGASGGIGLAASSSLTKEDVQTIETLPNVQAVTPMMVVAKPVIHNGQPVSTAVVIGGLPNMGETFFGSITEAKSVGRFLEQADVDGAKKVAVLFSGVSDLLFPDADPLGQSIIIGKDTFEVVGVRESPFTGNALGGDEFSNMIIIPITAAQEVSQSKEIHRLVLKVDRTEDVDATKNAITQAVLANHQGVEDFSVLTQEDFLSLFDTVLSVFTTMLAGIAAISLLVGGIGIMNIMLVSVTERTREIGLRKAIGASNADILVQFLSESLLLSILGGAAGVALAFLGGYVMGKQTALSVVIELPTILMALGFVLIVGIFFGVVPAIRASRLNPIDALKYE